MKLLAVDIGNSKIAVGRWDENRIVDRTRVSISSRRYKHVEPAQAVARAYDWCTEQLLHETESERIEGIAIASVSPRALEIWHHLWEGKQLSRTVPCTVIDGACQFPFEIDVREPATVGADRYCNVAGTLALAHASAIVVDLGTANTYDVVRNGRFLGGLIAPGCNQSHRALVTQAAQLPPIAFTRSSRWLGLNTVQAIQAGSFHQAVGGVSSVIEALVDRETGAAVVITGGMAEWIAPELPMSVVYEPDLTLMGAAALAQEWRCG